MSVAMMTMRGKGVHMRSALGIALLFFWGSLLSSPPATMQAETGTQFLFSGDLQSRSGSTVTIAVRMLGVPDPGLGDMMGTVNYPADLLEVDEDRIEGVAPYEVFSARVDEVVGKITFLVAAIRDFKKNGEIFRFRARVIGDADEEGELTLEGVKVHTGNNDEFTFSVIPGTFRVRDGDGGPLCSGLQASFTFSVSNLDVTFQDQSRVSGTNCRIASWAWDFGDGRTDTAQNPRHRYDKAGCYTVRLTVTDSERNIHSFSSTIAVAATLPDAKFDFTPKTVNAGDLVTFTYTGTTTAARLNFLWDFGDGSRSTEPSSTKHVFFKSGSLRTVLTVTNKEDNCSARAELTITVAAPKRPLVRSFPNPVNPVSVRSVTFNYSLPQGAGSASLKIFSFTGKPVGEIKSLSTTTDRATWTLPPGLPNGPYYYVLVSSAGTSKAGKFVVQYR
jgi:PKD repeat protein